MNSSGRNQITRRRMTLLLCGIVALSITLGGCEPLRKKFVRKKKKDAQQEFIPVLEPIDYPETTYTPGDLYRQHFSLYNVWYKDLLTNISDEENDKRQLITFNEMVTRLEEMGKLLSGDKQKRLLEITEEFKRIRQGYDTPAQMRSAARMKSGLNKLDREVREQFNFKEIEPSLVQTVPVE